jgi:hypothetical protein
MTLNPSIYTAMPVRVLDEVCRGKFGEEVSRRLFEFSSVIHRSMDAWMDDWRVTKFAISWTI